jgi:hypothetical protein
MYPDLTIAELDAYEAEWFRLSEDDRKAYDSFAEFCQCCEIGYLQAAIADDGRAMVLNFDF